MYSEFIEEQLLRCERAMRALLWYRDNEIPVKRIELMNEAELSDWGLKPEHVANSAVYLEAEEQWETERGMPASMQIRWRLIEAASGIPPALGDSIIFFFQQCFHLADWIYTCPISKVPKELVLEFVRSTDLAVCADYANGTKHLKLTRRTFSGRNQSTRTAAYIGDENSRRVSSWTIGEDGHDVFALAERCMARWREFLDQHVTKVPDRGEPAPPSVSWQQGEPWPPPGWPSSEAKKESVDE